MTFSIAGMGWITPLGADLAGVWERLRQSDDVAPESIVSDFNRNAYPIFRVPEEVLKGSKQHPRLRRASAISRFAAAAGLAAIVDSGLQADQIRDRIGLIFAIANGGVIYTRRFYHDIVAAGAGAASPLLFPETVFNAAASHLAAILGLTGVSYTLVGDGAVGMAAMRMAEDLLESNELDYCVVVGAEEADWLLCDAYHRWRLLKKNPPIELFSPQPKGTILSEGAGAVVVARSGQIKIEATHPGGYYSSRDTASGVLKCVLTDLKSSEETLVVCSANGTFVDRLEAEAIAEICPRAKPYSPKGSLGEAPGAGAIWQIIAASQALQFQHVPRPRQLAPNAVLRTTPEPTRFGDALVLTCGLNQQVGGLRLAL